MSERYSYDDVPYPSFTFAKTSPERLATLAAVNGMSAANPGKCTYLELGCGDGTNLLSHAYLYPNSQFLGIDLSETHIDSANQAVAELGLTNVEFRHMDLMDLKEGDLHQFDYIVAHGLFSWVPEPVRCRVLELYSECLEPSGVGYISYNTYPGCHIREIANGIMQFHTRGIASPAEKVSSSASILKFIGDVAPSSLYQSMLRMEFDGMIERRSENILHDDLSELNQPFYFYEFAEMLSSHGMQYLSETKLAASNPATLSADVAQVLNSIASDLIEQEQYIDLIRCRRFRSTLFCRKNVRLDRDHIKGHLGDFYLSAKLPSVDDGSDPNSRKAETFSHEAMGATINSNHPLTKACIRFLTEQWPWSVQFDELIGGSVNMFGLSAEVMSDSDVAQTRDFMIEMSRSGLVKLGLNPTPGASEIGSRPRASAFARWQIEHGLASVTNLTGYSLETENDIIRLIILVADGTRDRNEIVRTVLENLDSPEGDPSELRSTVEESVGSNLEILLKSNLLEA